jgi:5-methylcytosine-specific restriction endonuclease McrA
MPANYWHALTGLPSAAAREALEQLSDAGWTELDDLAQEVFVSGYFETQGVHRSPTRVTAARDAIASPRHGELAVVATAELDALIAGVEPVVPRGLRAAVFRRDSYKCQGCGWRPGDPVPLNRRGTRPLLRVLTIDHIVPRCRGGLDVLGNLQALCTSCNSSKGGG